MATCRVVEAPKSAAPSRWQAESKGGSVYKRFKKKAAAKRFCKSKRG